MTLKVLIVEDSMDDVLLLQRELRRGGYDSTVRRVDDVTSLAAALAEGEWDLVLCDYVIPGLDILDALRAVHRVGSTCRSSSSPAGLARTRRRRR